MSVEITTANQPASFLSTDLLVGYRPGSPNTLEVYTFAALSVAFAPAFGTQTANTIYAGPSSGSAAAPTFRLAVAADLPTALIATTVTAVTPASGAGNNVGLTATAAASGNNNGGNIPLTPGAGVGAGVAGYVAIEQPGGTVGTTEVRIWHDGTNANIKLGTAGSINFLTSTGASFCQFQAGTLNASFPARVVAATSFISGVNTALNINSLGWVTALAQGVLTFQNNSFGPGIIQNTGGTARLTAAVTNNTATMANLTDLSLPVSAGRKTLGRLTLWAQNSVAAEGLQVDLNGGSCTITSGEIGLVATPPTTGVALGTVVSTALATALTATTASTGDAMYVIEFEIVVNAGGTLIPRFAEVSHTAGTAQITNAKLQLWDSPN